MAEKQLRSVRGMNDLLPPDSETWVFFESKCREQFSAYGYGEIRTPILETTSLFARGIGDDTDIVSKEMYTFPDRKGRSLTMRPEMTASCVRSYIQHALHKKQPVTRWYYIGPMFRYERMQTGRYRQFYQVGVEAFGVAEPSIDAEQIAMIYELYNELGIEEMDVVINSVGGPDDRPAYRDALRAFLEPMRAELCGDCQRRIDTNPLRVLDCKVPTCKAKVADAPSILEHLSEASMNHFEGVQSFLRELGVPFRVDAKLVRGLDYYTGTVFEIIATGDKLGTQSTLVAGGRYDTLVETLGGQPTPATGFALGIERAVMTLPESIAAGVHRPPDAFIATRGEAAKTYAVGLAQRLRRKGLYIELDHRNAGMKSQFKRADKLAARYVIVIGDDELAANEVNLRNMDTREETRLAEAGLVEALA